MRSQALFDRAMEHVQSPPVVRRVVTLVVEHLSKIDGFDDLPDPLRQAIQKRTAELYTTGFIQGARWNEA